MKKVVSIFMALTMALTIGPVLSVRAEKVCEGENCQVIDGSLTGWAWCKENPKDCATYLGETASDKWSNTVRPWFSEKIDDVAKFDKQLDDFYNYDLNNQPKWTFWALMTSASVGALTLGTWFLNLVTCCGCGRCRLRMP